MPCRPCATQAAPDADRDQWVRRTITLNTKTASSKQKNSQYQSREFCGLRIQWFSSGHTARRTTMGAGPPRTDWRCANAHQGRDSRAEGVAQGGGGVSPSSPVVVNPVEACQERAAQRKNEEARSRCGSDSTAIAAATNHRGKTAPT